MQILDTQIISYAHKNTNDWQITNLYIASITAKEFLLVQDPTSTKQNYYVPVRKRFFPADSDLDIGKISHPFTKNSTDQIILNFGSDYPSVAEYGNLAIAKIINQRQKRLFSESIRFLNKQKQKTIIGRFNFLLDQGIQCIPLSRKATEIGFDLFFEFMSGHNPKQNLRNTIYDVLILATAIDSSSVLITQDKELNRFASEQYNGHLEESNGNLKIDFCDTTQSERRENRESKGYINRGWQASIKNHRGAW